MNQAKNNRTVGMMLGILFVVSSLFTDWFSIAHAKITFGGAPSAFRAPDFLQDMSFTVSGLHGTLNVAGIRVPIWLILALCVLSLLLMLLNQRKVTSLPRPMFVLPGAISVLCIGWMLAGVLSSEEATIHIGPMLFAAGVVICVIAGRSTLSKHA